MDNPGMLARRWFNLIVLLVLGGILTGCPVMQKRPPGPIEHVREPLTQRKYRLYVPTWYDASEQYPLVITLQGTDVWDGPLRQAEEWGLLAENHGFIIAAPDMNSTQGIFPNPHDAWFKNLAEDEEVILAMIEDLASQYNIDRDCIVLTGFSGGGFPMWYTGLRNPEVFQILIGRATNSSMEIFESIELTDAARDMPIYIFWGKDDLPPLKSQCWQAYRYLRERECFETEMKEIRGGHLRRPEVAYEYWTRYLPPKYRSRKPPNAP
jgi:poly(3-hydroxybutyrate) depolymerase